ncbi:hypothetical protein KIS4809_4919 [Bacillus sp. ZZV12-4809]|nr:hypothetical protein KIS4809_4919 [Bacillus sp. ZZV12-4809]
MTFFEKSPNSRRSLSLKGLLKRGDVQYKSPPAIRQLNRDLLKVLDAKELHDGLKELQFSLHSLEEQIRNIARDVDGAHHQNFP